MRNLLTTLCCLFTALVCCQAQSHRLLTTDGELSSNLINAIYQDHNNMIWIATEDGLNRYDGVKLTVYRHEPGNEHSLAHNYVRTLFEDNEGHLIIGTYAGLQLYDAGTDSFSPLAKMDTGEPFDSFITRILQRKNGEIWVTGNVLVRLHIKDGVATVEKLELPIPTELIESGIEDREGNFWITKVGDGIYKLTPDNRVNHYADQGKITSIMLLCEDMQGHLYGGSLLYGFFRYDKAGDRFVHLSCGEAGELPITAIYPADLNTLYLCTDGKGVKIYNIQTSTFSDYQFENNLIDSAKSKIHAMLKDNAGNYWFAVYQKGVIMVSTESNGFKYWGSKSISHDIIGSNSVVSLCMGSDDLMYVGTDNDGLYAIARGGKQQHHYSPTGRPGSVPAIVMALYEDSEENLWIGSFGNGCGRLDRRTGRYLPLAGEDEAARRLADSHVYAFAEDRDKRLWIATMGGGLYYYDLRSRKFCSDAQVNGQLFIDYICCLYYSPGQNCLYAGTYNGLYRIDLNSPERETLLRLEAHIIHALCEDSYGNIWAGTSSGLVCWNRQEDSFTTYTTADGLPNNAVYGVQSDGSDFLWLSTNRGLSRFFLQTRRFVNYFVNDGLQGNEFSKNATCHDREGRLWFGGINGVTYFLPQEIVMPDQKWHLRITDFYLHDRPVRTHTTSDGQRIIDRPVFLADDFYLSYRDNSFSIEFAATEFNTAARLACLYDMAGEGWHELPVGTNRVSFVGLSPGTYRFCVKAKEYIAESDVRTITIHIASPWWATKGAKAGYALAGLLTLTLAFLSLRNRYHTRQQLLEHRHREEIDEARQQFFINISHEIRTPMSLIISPLQQLMKSDANEGRQKSYRIIRRNAERILHLMNQLMDARKIEKKQMTLTFCEVELTGFIQDLCDTFAEMAVRKGITLTFHPEGAEELKLWMDMANFDKVILNLLSNAFKFTPEGGRVDISVCRGEDSACQGPLRRYVEITVADTGKGIAPEELERIFQRFYQAPGNGSTYMGTGIGLHLTRSLVELHHGHIHAENNPDGAPGCRFIVRIPLGNGHLRPDELEQKPDCVTPPAADQPQATGSEEQAVTPEQQQTAALPVVCPAPEASPEAGGIPTATDINRRVKHYVLVVEDDEEIRDYLCRELKGSHNVAFCSNGKEALEAIFRKEPDLVISDVMMPEMDGFTLCRTLKQNPRLRHIPVILLTAKTRPEDNIEGLDTGADAYLTKPFNIEVLRRAASNLIESRKQLRSLYDGTMQGYEEKLEKPEIQTPDDRLMERVIKVINSNLSNQKLTVEQIAAEVGLTRVHLNRKMKELAGMSPSDYIRHARLTQAAQLLSEGRHAISKVADLVGFCNMGHFSSAFKKMYGVTPKEYREKKKGEV